MSQQLDYSKYLSERARLALPDGIRGLFPLEKTAKVSFLAGKPNPSTFPFSSMTLHLKPPLGTDVSLEANGVNGAEKKNASGGIDLEIEGEDMEEALQYSATAGLPRLNAFLTEFTSKIHNRPIPQPKKAVPKRTQQVANEQTPEPSRPASPHHPTPAQVAQMKTELEGTATGEVTGEQVHALKGDEDEGEVPWRVTVGGGCQDLLFKAFCSLLNRGDPILLETPVYAGVLTQFITIGAKMIEVEVDDQGLSATALKRVLDQWPTETPKPKVLYCVPVGSNPTGCSSTTERKLEVLKLCVEHGIIILEDDPYYFLAADRRPSYFELETQVAPRGGYVVRFDSFSKVLSSGMRLGFAAGPEAILQAMDTNTSSANLQPNGVAQAVALRLLRHWGIKGFLDHTERVAQFYAGRRDIFEAIAHKHLDGLAKWVSPVAGMFLWIDVSPIEDSASLVQKEALELGVLAVPGFAFIPSGGKSSFLRVSFSIVDLEEKAEEGFRLLAQAIKQRLDKVKADGSA